MSRNPRSEEVIPGFPHHVTHRGNNQRRLFSRDMDYWRLVAMMVRARDKTACEVHAVGLMANHVHLIVTPPSVLALSSFVTRWAQPYARHRNGTRHGSGKLFESRFWSRPIVTDESLAITTLYVESNAFHAGVVAADPEDYRWSTAPIHAGRADRSGIPAALWTPSSWYLSLGVGEVSRAQEYRRRFAAYLDVPKIPKSLDPRDLAELKRKRVYWNRVQRPDGVSARDREEPYG